MQKQTAESKPKPLFYSIPQLAQRWAVSPYTVRRTIREGRVRAACLGRRLMVPIIEVERLERGDVSEVAK
jgi:hypothetical protein